VTRTLLSADFFYIHLSTLDATENIFKIGSTAPAAMLYDALDHFEVHGPSFSFFKISCCLCCAGQCLMPHVIILLSIEKEPKGGRKYSQYPTRALGCC
jgi:hypothetical protein